MATDLEHRPLPARGSSWRALQQRRRRRRLWIRGGIAVGVVAAAAATAIAVAGGGGDGSTDANPADLTLQLGDYFIRGDLEVPAGDIELEATNIGGLQHNVGIRGGPITTNYAPGKGGRIDLGVLAPGTYQLYCDVGDHEARGMVATLRVTDPQS